MSNPWQKKKVVTMSRLHLAAASGSISELDELISMKYDVNAVSGEGTNGRQTPLMLAARNGHLEPVIKLLRSGAQLETEDSYGQTALLRAVRGAQVAVVRVILENKANVDHQDHYGVTALHMAVEMDSAEMISLLVSSGANIEIKTNNKCQFPFMSPYRLACALNSLESAQELLDIKADVDSKDSHGTTSLLDALSRQKMELLRLIVRYNPNLYVSSKQTEGVMPLSYAAGKLSVPFVQLLVEAKADVNKLDLGGKTALHFAARTNNTQAIEYLLKVGADYTLRDKTNRDPASYGNQYGSKEAVKLLEAAWMNSPDTQRHSDPLALVKQKYIIKKKLGEGAFGKVLAVEHIKNGNEYACKFIKRKKLSESAEAYLDSEIQIMFEVPHPGICRLYEVIKTKQAVCLIMEVLRGGDVLQRIVEKDVLDEQEAARVVRSVASTLGFLHGLGIIHRDLKPDNLMYRAKNGADVVIVDFGVAKHLADSEKYASSACGTPLYLAPEVITGPQYTHMCDMWSLGVILYVMLCGRPPFYAKDRSHLFRKIKDGLFSFPEKYWKNVSQGAKDLISILLVVDPKKRASPIQVARHPWIRKHAGLKFQEFKESNSKVEEEKATRMAEGFACLSRVVRFLVAVKRLYARFDLGTIDGASLRLLGAYRQGTFKPRVTDPGLVASLSTRSRRVMSQLKEFVIQPLMVVKVKNFDGEFVIERKYEGDLPGMEDHWWVSGSEGQMHVVGPADIMPIDKSGKAVPQVHRRTSFYKDVKPLDTDITIQHEMRIIGPGDSKGKTLKWKMVGWRDELMDVLPKEDRITLMFWNHIRLFVKRFGVIKSDQKKEHKMLAEAKRIQLMFLKKKACLKLTTFPKKVVHELDRLVTENKVDGSTFQKSARTCQKILEMRMWESLLRLIPRFQELFRRIKKDGTKRLMDKVALILPKRLLDLMASPSAGEEIYNKGDSTPIMQGHIEIASLQTDEEQGNDLRQRLHKILASELYTELNALAKVVGEDSELLVPGRRLYFAAPVKKKARMVFSSVNERKLVLCNDILAWLTPKLKLQRFIPLTELTCSEAKEEGRFCVVHQKKTYDFICKNKIEAKQWVQVINKTKEEWKQLGKNPRASSAVKEGEGVLSDIKHHREKQFSRMKRHALRDLVKTMKKSIDVKKRSKNFNTHSNSFVGEEFVQWMLKEKLVPNVQAAVRIGNELIVSGYVEHVSRDHGFRNNNLLYKINETLVKVGDKGAAVVRTLTNQNPTSISRSISAKQGGKRARITFVECQAKVVWKLEGRTRVPHAVLCLWSDSQPGEEDIISLADARTKPDAKDPLIFRVVPGGVDVSEDESYYEEYQIKCESEEKRDEWVKLLQSLHADEKTLGENLRKMISRAEEAILSLVNVSRSHDASAETKEAKIPESVSGESKDVRYISVNGEALPVHPVGFLKVGDFPFPASSREDLEDIFLQGLVAFFGELIGDKWTTSMTAMWKILTTTTSWSIVDEDGNLTSLTPEKEVAAEPTTGAVVTSMRSSARIETFQEETVGPAESKKSAAAKSEMSHRH
uniref:Non-specific serine/threonine protein kinase n=1 Tax=Lotharella globosa TaxID=91324 RepID=A0A7S3YEG1_9EUKA|mmetsp:Transcript_1309/g.2490  ORF Transcript_1309/g.2490 Transcript_1309/m.2490 type:complete len:1543 (+) Transcript_1309:102-4730(+)